MLKNQNEIKSIQILRALAAMCVVYYHIQANPNFGSFGVDIFFVISGFVIALVATQQPDPLQFCLRRIFRIVPLYWILTTCLLVLAFFKPSLLNSTTADPVNYLKSLFFIPYFKENGALHPMLALGWTLNYEMFFYFCTWLSIAFWRKLNFVFVTSMILVSYISLGLLSHNAVCKAFFGNEIIFEFILGLLLFFVSGTALYKKVPGILWLFSAVVSFAFLIISELMHFEMGRIVLYGVPSLILTASVLGLEESIQRLPLCNVLVRIGYASYAIYLSHFYVTEGIRKLVSKQFPILSPYTPLGAAITLMTSISIGYVIYLALDKPIHGKLKNWLKNRTFPATPSTSKIQQVSQSK